MEGSSQCLGQNSQQVPVKHIRLNKIKMKAPRKHNNINKNSITKKDNTTYDSDSEEETHIKLEMVYMI